MGGACRLAREGLRRIGHRWRGWRRRSPFQLPPHRNRRSRREARVTIASCTAGRARLLSVAVALPQSAGFGTRMPGGPEGQPWKGGREKERPRTAEEGGDDTSVVLPLSRRERRGREAVGTGKDRDKVERVLFTPFYLIITF
jgi:hypothetical protein